MVDWVQKKGWFIQAGTTHVFRKKHDSFFTLSKESPVGGRDTYRVKFDPPVDADPGSMDPVWKDCVLIERGSTPLAWTADALGSFDPNDLALKQEYREAIASVMPSATADTLRLVGEIPVGNRKETVIFVLAQEAVIDAQGEKQALLIMIVSTQFPLGADLMLMEDGTGHARPT